MRNIQFQRYVITRFFLYISAKSTHRTLEIQKRTGFK